jgi:hypothetical protein
MKFATVVASAAAALAAAPVQAWWDNGHMLVGEVASQLMAPEDVQTIEKALSYWERDFPNTNKISTAAIWADLVKCNTVSPFCNTTDTPSFPQMDKWHYVNLPLNTNGARWGGAEPDLTLFAQSFGGEAGDVMDQFLRTFNSSRSPWSINLGLRQLIHILGDVHNPMHTVGGVNVNNPKGDSGGNAFTFVQPCAANNLHALYDNGGGQLLNNWAPKYTFAEELKKNASELISSLPIIQDNIDLSPVKGLPYDQFYQAFTKASYFKKFILESHTTALNFVYPALDLSLVAGTKNVQCPPDWYVAWAAQISKFRIAVGGRRLAFVLTEIAKHLRAIKVKFD